MTDVDELLRLLDQGDNLDFRDLPDPDGPDDAGRENLAVLRWINQMELLDREEKLAQYKDGYFKLPVVPKVVYVGTRGGQYYINQRGNKVYLGRRGQDRLQNGRLLGLVDEPPAGSPPMPAFDVRLARRRLAEARQN